MPSLGDLFITVGAKLDNFKSAMKEVGNELQNKQSAFQRFGSVASVGLATVGAGAFAAAVKFNDAFTKIGNSTGATGKKLDDLKDSFTNVYKQVDESSDQVAEALALLATRTGATGKALEDMTVKLLDLAKVQNETATELAPLVTRTFGDWSIATEKQAEAMDFLGVVSQQTGSKVSRLSETVVTFGAPLRELGYTFEEATTLVAKFDKEGVNVETVLAGMKKALAAFAAAGQDPAKKWAEFVAGVKSGAVSMETTMKLVGTRLGTDVFKAIKEGRFDIDKTTESFKELSKQGLQTTNTLKEQWTTYIHQIESVIMKHSDLIVSLSMMGPLLIKGLAALGVTVSPAAIALGAVIGGAIYAGLETELGQKFGNLAKGIAQMFDAVVRHELGLMHRTQQGPGDFRGPAESRSEYRKAQPAAPALPGTETPGATPGAFDFEMGGKKKKEHFEPQGPQETYFETPFNVEAI